MNKLNKKAIYSEFKSDILQYGILDALNRLSFEIGYLKTFPFTDEREIVYEKYKLRKAKISRFKKMFKRG